jgi:hypothetical protein
MEKMMKLPPLGDRKPSVMLAEMLEVCPAGESTTAIFAYLFLQRLPREIRVLLSEDDPADMRAIADKADRLIAMHVPQGHDACTAVASLDLDLDQDLVAATSGAKKKKKVLAGRQPQQQAASGQRGGFPRRSAAQAAAPRTSMCFYHARFGEKARYCEEGCSWPEN